ncbi:hypothetical protein NBRC116590_03190 [Pelagimonas sp. KU-00592-HH]|uniref:hypothetical protein n=1 Tax=Pelagimonas sp. KU-00592-HH TaxID=3127651 RepID=UPI00310472D0
MAELEKDKLPNVESAPAESVIDRSTRISRQIVKDEAEERELKTARLRNERLEKEADGSQSESEASSQAIRGKT